MTHSASPSTADTDWFLYSWRLRCIDSSPWQSFPRQHLITDHCWLTDVRHGQMEPFDKQPRLVKPSSAFTYLYLWSHLINSRFSWNLSQSRLIWARFRFQSVMPINHPIDSCLGPVTRWTYKEYYPTSPTMPYDHLLCRVAEVGRLSASAKNAFNSFVGHVFPNSRQKTSFFRVIPKLQQKR